MGMDFGKPPGTSAARTAEAQGAAEPGRRALTDGLEPRSGPPAMPRSTMPTGPLQRKDGGEAPLDRLARIVRSRVQPVQRAAAQARSAEDATAVHAVAAEGISGAGGSLPHLEQIQRSFGRHDVSHAQAHVDEPDPDGALPSSAVFDEQSSQREFGTPNEATGPALHSPMATRVASDDQALDAEGIVAASHAGSSAPVPVGIRTRVEAVAGADLSGVQLHHGAIAETTAAALGARAWTFGRDVHFGAGQYHPGTPEGDHLIAHELVHTAQQADSGQAIQHKLGVGQPGDPFEIEADALADRATAPASSAHRTASDGLAAGRRSVGVAVRTGTPIVQPSFISFAVKMGAKRASRAMLRKFLKEQVKDKLEKVAIKKVVKQFAKEADQIIGILEDPWWVTAVGFIPIIGDAFDLVHVPKQIAAAIKKADQLEERVKRLLSLQGRRAGELIPATLKRSESYAEELAQKTYAEIVEMAASSEKAAKMKKLIEQTPRLMEKL